MSNCLDQLEKSIRKYFSQAFRVYDSCLDLLKESEKPVNAVINLAALLRAVEKDENDKSTKLNQFLGLHKVLKYNIVSSIAEELSTLKKVESNLKEYSVDLGKKLEQLEISFDNLNSRKVDWNSKDLNPALPSLQIIFQWAEEFNLYIINICLKISAALAYLNTEEEESLTDLQAAFKPESSSKISLIRSADLSTVQLIRQYCI